MAAIATPAIQVFRPPPGLEDAVPEAHLLSMLGSKGLTDKNLLQVPPGVFHGGAPASSRSTSPGCFELSSTMSSSSEGEEGEQWRRWRPTPLQSPGKVQLQLASALLEESTSVPPPPPPSPVLCLSDLLVLGDGSSANATAPPSPQGSQQLEVEARPTELSVGSAGHGQGLCKPCAFFHTKGCSNGAACSHCHLCLPGEKRRRRADRKEAIAARKRGEH